MALNDLGIRAAKPAGKPFKLADEKGLFLLINPNGSKLFRMKYRFGGKEKLLSFGTYPDVSLKQARDRRDEARRLLAQEVDPGAVQSARKQARAIAGQDSFEAVAREWMKTKGREWTETYASKTRSCLEHHVFPSIGKDPIKDLSAPGFLTLFRAIEKRGTIDMAHRVQQHCGAIFRFAIATGKATDNPVQNLKGALATTKRRHYAAITDPDELTELLCDIDDYRGEVTTKAAMQLLALTFQRTKEVRFAEWRQFDFVAGLWRIPAAVMKMREAHLVPLSRQVLAVLEELKPLTGQSELVFPSTTNRNRPISENTVTYALARMGYKGRMTGHGFRTVASTLLNAHGNREEVIERQLDHEERNQVRAAYNRAEYLPERRAMMQAWADYLDQLRKSAKRLRVSRSLAHSECAAEFPPLMATKGSRAIEPEYVVDQKARDTAITIRWM